MAGWGEAAAAGEAGTPRDRRAMRRVLALAHLGMGATHPNPRVGALALRDDRIVGRGAHLAFGGPHAEAALLAAADPALLQGATLYVNLEPCAHHGKTAPCAPAIARSGLRRVIVAIEDPNPRVSGRGLALLREAGIEVATGVQAEAARRLNAPFLWYLAGSRSLLTLKIAASLDGRVRAADGSSRWISGPAAREQVHRWRASCDALLIGRGTLVADRPRLSARPARDPWARLRAGLRGAPAWPHQPARVVVDRACRLAENDELLGAMTAAAGGRWIIACGRGAPTARRNRAREAGFTLWMMPEGHGGQGVDLAALLGRLAAAGHLDVMAEAGPTLAAELLRQRLVDRLRLFQAPLLLGGEGSWAGDLGIPSLAQALRLAAVRRRRYGSDTLIEGWSRPVAEAIGLIDRDERSATVGGAGGPAALSRSPDALGAGSAAQEQEPCSPA